MRKALILCILLLCVFMSFSQTVSIKGSLKDTSSKTALEYGAVSLLRVIDSVLQKFTRAAVDGSFEIKDIIPDSYVLLITYPGYADYADIISLQKNEDFGQIAMLTQAMALQNVIVRGGGAIRIKGDTTAFMADSFKVREGASVADLLKRLPGFQVNKKGEITAQGEKVEKVLVDGEEFFGDDPTIATENLQAANVKEVQLFDKKSDQATFTGVDDGQKTKTINLKMKDDAKNGYFGKVKLAGGLPDRWDNSAMINFFKGKRKLSAYGMMSNTGTSGLNWEDDRNYGGNMDMVTEIGDDGSMMMYSFGDDFGGQGLPRNWSGGLHFSNKWNADKNNINSSYRYQKLMLENSSNDFSQYILPDTQYFINNRSLSYSTKFRHKGNVSYDITLDSNNSVRISADGFIGQSKNFVTNNSENLYGDGSIANKSERKTNNNLNNGAFNSSLLWRRKFKKKGRTLSLNFAQKYNIGSSDGYLLNYNEFYKSNVIINRDSTDQLKLRDNNSLNVDSKISYTEPLSKKSLIEITYGYNIQKSEAAIKSFDKASGKYDQLNTQFSNDYKFNTQTHIAGASYRYSAKKLNFGFGGSAAKSDWKQTDLIKDSIRSYDFTNFFPKANLSYKISGQSSLRFNYNGNTRAPSLNQLQPVANNDDPLNILIGNPNLKQSFNHSFSLSYNNYQVLTSRSMYGSLGFNTISNAFSSRDSISTNDSIVGQRISQTVNVSGNYNIYGYFGYGFKIKKPELNIDLSASINNSRQNNFVNSVANVNNNQSYSLALRVSKYVENKYAVNLSVEQTRNLSKSSIRPDVPTNYWSGNPTMDINVTLPWKMSINTDVDYNWRQKINATDVNNNVFKWNASLDKKIFKKGTGLISVKVNDILDQNKGFSRYVTSNYVSQQNYDVIRRFWLLSFTWNFSKNGGKPEAW